MVLIGPEAGRLIPIGSEVTLGRDVDGPGLLVDDGVSRRHARVHCSESDDYHVGDMGSRNGTYVNGARIETAALVSGDKIAIGARTIMLFTRYGQYEEHILQQQKMQALGQLAGGVAHDFNNLLGAILGNVSYMTSNPRTEDERTECLAEVEMAARRAAELTSRLLTFARRRERCVEPVHVSALIEEATALLRRALPRVVQIVTEIAPRLYVMGDGAQLLQVLMNAGINAGHAMPSGGRLVFRVDQLIVGLHSETGRAELTPGKYVRLQIADTGTGMDSEVLDQVFQPFFSTKPEGEGTGLGMATAQSVVREHGGDIDIQSSQAQGSRVTVYLPAAEPSQPDAREEPAVFAPLSGRILVADDELLVRSTARRLLRGFGLYVDVASDGNEALETLLASQFDLAILGDDLRGIGAERVISMVKPRVAKTRFLISSSRHQSLPPGAIDRVGVSAFLRKPFDGRTLYAAIVQAMTPSETT